MGYSVESVDGRYQVIDRDKSIHGENGDINGGNRLASAEQFINGSPDVILCGVVEDILNIMQDTMTGVAKSSCGTVDGRASAVVLADRLHLSIDTLFNPPESILRMMDSVLGIVKDNLGRLDGDSRKDYVRFVTRHLIRTYDNMVGYDLKYGRREKVVAGFTFDDFMFEVMIRGGSFLDRLERLGIGTVIDGPEEVLDPDVDLAFMRMEDSFKNINIGFALVTRPSDLGLREALKTLPRMLSTGISRHFSNKGMLTWKALACDWDDDGLVVVLHEGHTFGYAHAAALIMNGIRVSPDKVNMIMDVVFSLHEETSELNAIRKYLLQMANFRFDQVLSAIISVSYERGDMELLKALAWVVLLSEKVFGRNKYRKHLARVVPYGSVMSALDQYNDGMPWSFIVETMKASISKYDWKSQNGSTVLFNEDESSENGILINLVDYPHPWPDGSQES